MTDGATPLVPAMGALTLTLNRTLALTLTLTRTANPKPNHDGSLFGRPIEGAGLGGRYADRAPQGAAEAIASCS